MILRHDDPQLDRFSAHGRTHILAIVRRIGWLTLCIEERATQGLPIGATRLERKALRWALLELGVHLPPNPPIPDGTRDREIQAAADAIAAKLLAEANR